MPDNIFRIMDALDAFDEGIYIVNDDYSVEYMNKFMRDLFGDGVGKKCHKVIKNSDQPCEWCEYDEILKKSEPRSYEVYIPRLEKTFMVTDLPVLNRDGSKSKLSIYKDLSHRIAQEARLKSSEENYKRLFTHAGCGVFTSSKRGRFLDVNPALLKIMGYEDKEAFLSLDLAKDVYLDPKDRQTYMTTIESQGQVVDYEVKWKRKDGQEVDILLTSNVRYGPDGEILGYEGIVVDQTQRKVSENRIREAYDFLDKIISCSPNAIMALDMRGVVKLWNDRAAEAFGYAAEQVVDRMTIGQIYSEEVSREVMKMMRSDGFGGKGKLNSYPLTIKKNDEDVIEGNLSASIAYDEQGNELASVAILVDLKERLNMERQLGEARQHLLQSEKLAAMGRLTSQIAHELNNPLFGIMNTLELMKTEISPQNKRRKLLDMSLSETVRLADMLKKMLSFSKPDQEKKVALDINMVLDELLMLYEKQFRENSIKLRTSLAEDPGLIMGSKDQLRQVFINLFSNAMDVMPNGGKLLIRTEVQGSKLHIEVADDGVGIKEAHKEKIFDSFFTTKTESVKGVGLGLSVCYGFIKEHDGDIRVDSVDGQGASFKIDLPLIQDS